MQPISEKNNFHYLCIGLIILLLISALIENFPGDLAARFVQAATVSTLLFVALGNRAHRSSMAISLTFMLLMCIVITAGIVLDSSGFGIAHLLLLLVFLLWVTWASLKQVLFTGQVDRNTIVGAICIYMLMGLVWALLYLLIAEIVPDSFNGMAQAPWLDNFAEATYFSFVTLTTLGYGDISPVFPLARFLVYMEAIVGLFYMAILVASLIGVRLSGYTPQGDQDT